MDGEESHPRPQVKDSARPAAGPFLSGPSALQRALHLVRARLGGPGPRRRSAGAGGRRRARDLDAAARGGAGRRAAALGRPGVGLRQPAASTPARSATTATTGPTTPACPPASWPAAGTGCSASTSRSATTATAWRATAAPSACLSCPRGGNGFSSSGNGHCYWREDEPLSFDDAAARCVRGDGHLVTFADDREWREVTEQLLAGGNAPARLDRPPARRTATACATSAGWTARGCSRCTGRSRSPGARPAGWTAACRSAAGTWAASSCNEQRAYVCERPAWVVEPRTGSAYRRYVERVPWERAQAHCADRGGHLVTFSDLSEQAFVASQFQGAVWIGAQMVDERGRFGWLTGEAVGHADFAPGRAQLPGRAEVRGAGRRPALVQPPLQRPAQLRLRKPLTAKASRARLPMPVRSSIRRPGPTSAQAPHPHPQIVARRVKKRSGRLPILSRQIARGGSQ